MAEFIQFRAKKSVKAILYLSLLLNIAWAMLIFVFQLLNTSHMNYQLQQLKALNKPVHMELCNYRCFKSNELRFKEAGIMLTDTPLTTGKSYDIAYSTSKFMSPAPLPELPKGFVLTMAEKVGGK